LVGAADCFDVVHLLVLVTDFIHSENVQVFGDKLQQFFSSTPSPQEDIFTYITRVSTAKKDIERLNEIIGAEAIKVPDYIIVWKIFQAVRSYPQLDFFFKSFLVQKPREWLKLTPDELVAQITHYTTNTRDLDAKEKPKTKVNVAVGVPAVPRPPRPPRADKGVCFSFFNTGRCSFMTKGLKCRFSHAESKRGPTPQDRLQRIEARNAQLPPPARRDSVSSAGSLLSMVLRV